MFTLLIAILFIYLFFDCLCFLHYPCFRFGYISFILFVMVVDKAISIGMPFSFRILDNERFFYLSEISRHHRFTSL